MKAPASLLDELKALANERDVPYQSLLKVFLAGRIARERGMRRKASAWADPARPHHFPRALFYCL